MFRIQSIHAHLVVLVSHMPLLLVVSYTSTYTDPVHARHSRPQALHEAPHSWTNKGCLVRGPNFNPVTSEIVSIDWMSVIIAESLYLYPVLIRVLTEHD